MKDPKPKTALQRILKRRSLSQKELREKINQELTSGEKEIVAAALSKIVTGKQKNYTIRTLKKISKALNVTTDEILENDVKLG